MGREPLRRAAFLVAAGVLVSAAAGFALFYESSARARADFESSARIAEDAIVDRVETCIALLRGAAGLFASAGDAVTVQSFRAFMERVALREQYPGLLGIGYTGRLDPGAREAVERRMREQGHAAFRVWPDGVRAEIHSILFLEPLDERNRAAIGFDMFSHPVRRAAMERARDEGRAAASAIVELVQEIHEEKQPGFLLYLPVYRGGAIPGTREGRRRELAGFAYAPIRAGDFLSSAFAPDTVRQVGIAVYHGAAEAERTLLYRHAAAGDRGRFRATRELDVAGQRWTVEFRSQATLGPALAVSLLAFAAGVALTALLALLMWREARARTAIERALLREREAQQELGLVTESMANPVVRCARDGRFVWTNDAYARWLGRPRAQIIGRRIPEVLGATEAEALRPYIERVLAGEAVQYERRAAYAGAGVRWVSVAYTPIRAPRGEVTGWVAVVTDITERKDVEDALFEAARRKDEFLATLAHELRNPLAPVRNAVYLLKAVPPGDPAAETARQIIERQVAQMVRLMDDLMDVSRIGTGKLVLRRQAADLREVARSALEAAEPVLRARGHRLEASLPAGETWVDVDATRLAQVLLNLLNNAAKFTEPGGHIHLHAGLEGDTLIARVRDDGIGIPAGQLEAVFRMFNQAGRPLERTAGGLGVGLALARRLVELHGGTIEARSEGEGRGAEFIVRIPRAAAARGTAHAQVAAGARTRRRILVVDDNAEYARSLAEVLVRDGHEVAVEHDGAAGLAAAQSFRPDFALLDIGMPGMNGFDLARRLREADATRHSILVALTGYGQPADRAAGREAGFDHYFVKPVDVEVLLEVLRR